MNLNLRFAIILIVLIGLWLLSGLFVSSNSEESSGIDPVSVLTKVEAKWFEERQFQPQVSLRARTEASRAVELKAQISGRVIAVPTAEGKRVVEGEVVCEIDAEDRPLKVIQEAAAVEQAEIEYQGALRLKKGGYQSEVAIAQAKANLERARASLKRSQLDVENLQIKAPFAGIVETRPAEVGDFMQLGHLCATFIELDPLKVTALATEKDVGQLRVGEKATIELVTGEELKGQLSYIARQADAVTRTYKVEVTAANPDDVVRGGISGRLSILGNKVRAHFIPSHLVLLDDKGGLMVRAIDDEKVVSWPIRIVGEEAGGVWVAGLPVKVALVVVGQNYISNGEQVDVSFWEGVDQTERVSAP